MREPVADDGTGHTRNLSGGSEPPRVPGWVALLCLAVCLAGILNHEAWTPDEVREAAICLEMSRTGNVVVPHLAGEPFVEKPPLYSAFGAAAIRLLGRALGNTGAVRLTSALWALGTLGLTFLMARRLLGVAQAGLALVFLATMRGFLEVSHWILVDSALLFFVTAAVWAFAEAYAGGRPALLAAAGAFAAGAFLSKGLVGPLLIAAAWPGLVLPWLVAAWRQSRAGGDAGLKPSLGRCLAWHGVGLLVFLLLAGTWVLFFRRLGGPALWHEWWWKNHVERFSGASTYGHIGGHRPFYYLLTLLHFCLPWTPAVFLWFFVAARDFARTRRLLPARVAVAVWILLSLALLSVSETKRDIYLFPLLPALALAAAEAVGAVRARWLDAWLLAWCAVCATGAAFLCVGPFLGGKAGEFFGPFTLRNLAAAAGCAAIVVALARRRPSPLSARAGAVTAAAYLVLLVVACPLVDVKKSLKPGCEAIARAIPGDGRRRTAAWNFDETTRGAFYFYLDWAVPRIEDNARALSVLAGQDGEFRRLIVMARPGRRDEETFGHLPAVLEVDLAQERVLRLLEAPGTP